MYNIFDDLSTMQIHKLYDLLGVHRFKYDENQEMLSTIKNNNIVGIIVKRFC